MRWIIKGLAGAAGLLVILAGIGFVLPTHWHVQESVIIDSPPEKIHPYVNQLRNWTQWAAWNTDQDPSLSYTYEGPEAGAGAVMKWKGGKTGFGRLKITKSDPQKGVWMELAVESDDVNAQSAITYETVAAGTKVTWTDDGDVGMQPIGGYFVPLIKPTLSEHFREGLSRLKKQAESRTSTHSSTTSG